MNTFVKYPQRQDCDLKLSAGNSGETSINLSTDIAIFLNDGKVLSKGDEVPISFTIYREDFIKALCHIIEKLPLYRTSSNSSTKIEYNNNLFINYMESINSFFHNNETKVYNVTLSAVSAPRYYLKNLNDSGLNIRKFIIENNSTLHFSKEEDKYVLRLLSGEIKSQEQQLEFNDTPSLILKNSVLKNFVLDTVIHLQNNESLDRFLQFLSSNVSTNVSLKGESFSLTGMFLDSTLEDVKERNSGHVRWFEEPLFSLGERHLYLSTQWNGSGNYQLTLNDFKELIKACYNDKYFVKVGSEGVFELWGYTSNETQIHQVSPFSTSTLIEKIKSTGLIYSDELVKRFAYALMTKPFVILSGLAGSGKTQLALAFAECMSEDVERQVRVVSVGADWTNREPLLGYPNALKSNDYVKPECGALDMLIEATENPDKPYFLILDEMNLSVVERYFADFLSSMESKKPIALWKGTSNEECERPVPHEIMLPKNLYIIGTINVDETTYMFSPKVLDRANVIEFKIAASEMESFLEADKMVDRSVCHSGCADMAQDFLERTNTSAIGTDTSAVQGALNGFFKELKSVNAEFGYRTASEIYRYINNVGNDLGDHGAVDTAILQKLLPKLHGSRKKLSPVLSALWKLCFAEESGVAIESVKDFANVEGLIYKNSAEKILRMYKAVVDNGFTSFAEA